MHGPKEPSLWAREYLPGYTGHVPLKREFYGKTSGSINREINESGGNEVKMGHITLTKTLMGQNNPPAREKMNEDVYGNSSKNA